MKYNRNLPRQSAEPNANPTESPFETAMFAAEIGDVPSVDLHEKTPEEAINALDTFLNRAFVDHVEAVRIIHGRGSGKLRASVRAFLETHKLVAAFRNSHQPHEDGGVIIAALDL